MEARQAIVGVRTTEGWLFRAMQDGMLFTVRGNVSLVDAKRTIEPQLDHEYGRKGWFWYNH